MKWFGESWGAPVCEPEEHVRTPDGEVCPCGCLTIIYPGDAGFVIPHVQEDGFVELLAWHRDHFLRTVIGKPAPVG